MRKPAFLIIVCGVLAVTAIYFSSCKVRNETNPPELSFLPDAGYVSDDTTLYRHTTFSIWIYASIQGLDDLLESGYITRRVNNGITTTPDTVLSRFTFVSTQFSQVYSYILGDSGTVTTYTFTIGNENGVTASDSVEITAN